MKHVKLTNETKSELTDELLIIKSLAARVRKRYGISMTVIARNGDSSVVMADNDTMECLKNSHCLSGDNNE